MKIKFSDMSSMIAEEVIKVLAPRVRKIVREEVNKGIKTLIKEQKISQQMMLSNNVNVNNNSDNLTETKEAIAKRAHDKARDILEKQFSNDDPFAELIMSAEDPQQQQKIQEQIKLSKPLTKVSDVDKNNVVAADLMDFSEMVDRIT
jgi:hypothetical protein